MGEVKLEFISDGFRQILMSDGVRALVEKTTNDIKQKADSGILGKAEGFKAHVFKGGYGGGRWVGSVYTTDFGTMAAEAERKVLTKAVK